MNEQMTSAWQASKLTAFALIAAALLHGMFSSPAPKALGIAEILIAVGLCIAAMPRLPNFLDAQFLRQHPDCLAWLWLLLIPLFIALISGNDGRDVSRDVMAICFLGLPVLVGGIDQKYLKKFALALAAGGAMIALRYWIITDGFSAFRNLKHGDSLLYLALDPLVLFAAIYFPIQLIEIWFSERRRIHKILLCLICMAAAILCWGALSGMMMRGAIALGIFALSFYALRHWQRPFIPIIMAAVAIAVIVVFFEPIARFMESLAEKTQHVGLNARDAEFAAIWNIQAADPLAFLFGQGWGATYASPAVGGYFVNYSHSALGFYFLKTGVIGVLILGFYLWRAFLPLRESRSSLLFAVVPPLVLSFTLYTSYKFLGCGLLLLLLVSHHAHPDPQPR